MLASKSVGANV